MRWSHPPLLLPTLLPWSDDAILTWKCLYVRRGECACMHVKLLGLDSSQGKSKPFVPWRYRHTKLKASAYLHTCTHAYDHMHALPPIHTFKSASRVAFTNLYSLLLKDRHTGMSYNQLVSFNCVLTKAVHRILRSSVCMCATESNREKEGYYCEYYYHYIRLIIERGRE